VSPRGAFLVVEGIDGCGKSTQVRRLATARDAVATFEPGATTLGSSLRALLLEDADRPVPVAEALLMAADRAQHVASVIEPALERGSDVISDRYASSTLAYQGYGRGLDLLVLGDLMALATGGLRPDLTILLDLPVGDAAARRTGSPDRMEAEHEEFFERVRQGYLDMAANDPSRWVVIDATAPLADVTAAVDEAIVERGLA